MKEKQISISKAIKLLKDKKIKAITINLTNYKSAELILRLLGFR